MASDALTIVNNPMITAVSNKEIKGVWCDLNLTCLNDWSSKAVQYRWMHNYAASSFKHSADMLSVSVALFGYVSGGSVLTSSVDQSWLRFFVAFLSIGAGVLTNIQSVLGWKELAEKHHQTSKQFSRIHQDIMSQLSLDPAQREDPRIYINNMKKEYTDAVNNSPPIPLWITKVYRDKLEAAENKRKKRTVITDLGGNTVFVRGEFIQPASLTDDKVSPTHTFSPMTDTFRTFVRKHMIVTAATTRDPDEEYLEDDKDHPRRLGVSGEGPARRIRHLPPTPMVDEHRPRRGTKPSPVAIPKPGPRSASPVHRLGTASDTSSESEYEDNSVHERMSKGSRGSRGSRMSRASRRLRHAKVGDIPSLASARRGSNAHFSSPLGPEHVVVSIAADPLKRKHSEDDRWLD